MKFTFPKITLLFLLLLSLVGFPPVSHASKDKASTPKVALITGASRGIGFSLTKQLLEEGLHVIAVARKVESLEELEKRFSGHLQIISADLSTKEGQLSVAPAVGKATIDFLVHNAAVIDPLGKDALLEASPDEIHHIFAVNVVAPMVLTTQLSPNLKEGSRILMISSRAGDKAAPGAGFYSVTKVALDRYTESLKLDRPHNVLAASVHPGDVNTDMQGDLRKKDSAAFPRGEFFRERKDRLTSPETSARYLAWLLLKTSDQAFTAKKHNIYDPSHQAAWSGGEVILDPFVK